MRSLALFLVCGLAAAQSLEPGRIERSGTSARVIVQNNPRPLASAAIALFDQFHISVSVEDVPYSAWIPGALDVSFPVGADGKPTDIRALLENLRQSVDARNQFGYRLDEDNGAWTFIATRTREAQFLPLLDRRITIPFGMHSVAENARLMAEELARQTGTHVGCCQSVIAGVPWGLEVIPFEAHNEPARSVLLRLTRATPGRFAWYTSCGPGVDWCFIQLEMRSAR